MEAPERVKTVWREETPNSDPAHAQTPMRGSHPSRGGHPSDQKGGGDCSCLLYTSPSPRD
eukprot:6233945-Alexandrium_andersonii.AAC.1